jgi:hypothetical protein
VPDGWGPRDWWQLLDGDGIGRCVGRGSAGGCDGEEVSAGVWGVDCVRRGFGAASAASDGQQDGGGGESDELQRPTAATETEAEECAAAE